MCDSIELQVDDTIIDIDTPTDESVDPSADNTIEVSSSHDGEVWISNDPRAREVLGDDDFVADNTVDGIISADTWDISAWDHCVDPPVHKLPPSADSILTNWIAIHESNGIVQHSKEWLEAKRYVVGGSKIAMVAGTCPYSVVGQYVREKSSGINNPMGIAAQWGNLMEEIIKQQVERDYECTVLGEDLYVRDQKYNGVAYSPDGVAVMLVGSRGSPPTREGSVCNLLPEGNPLIPPGSALDAMRIPRVVLVEFKCPWSRVLDGSPPANYVPQVLMGLDMIRVASLGLLAEAVYRRCTIPQLSTNEFNDEHTRRPEPAAPTTAVRKAKPAPQSPQSPSPHIWSGIIGVFVRHHPMVCKNNLYDDWPQWYADIQKWKKESGADFGRMPADVFTTLMAAIDRHDLQAWYPAATTTAVDATREFMGRCAATGSIALGVIPWKLIRIDYHWIAPIPGYIEQVGPRIDMINNAVISAINNPRDAHNIISDFDADWEALTGVSSMSRGKPLHSPAVEVPVVGEQDDPPVATMTVKNKPAFRGKPGTIRNTIRGQAKPTRTVINGDPYAKSAEK